MQLQCLIGVYMLLGGILLVGGALGFVWSSNNIAEYQTFVGQLGRALSDQVQQSYQEWQVVQYGSIAAAMVGIALVIYGAVAKDHLNPRQSYNT